MNDRRVHARTSNGREVVRYERAGKWYWEIPGGARAPINLSEAVWLARLPGSTVVYGLPGGSRFDAAVDA